MLIAITIAGSKSDKVNLTINQSGNAIDLARNANLRNTFPDRFASLALEFWNSQENSFDTNLSSCHTNNQNEELYGTDVEGIEYIINK